jgi:hypothetical protein
MRELLVAIGSTNAEDATEDAWNNPKNFSVPSSVACRSYNWYALQPGLVQDSLILVVVGHFKREVDDRASPVRSFLASVSACRSKRVINHVREQGLGIRLKRDTDVDVRYMATVEINIHRCPGSICAPQ